MPWETKDVERHFKGLSDREKRMWCHVANGALEAGDDDGTACHKANGVVKKNRIKEHIEALLFSKVRAMVEELAKQEIANIFEGALGNQPEGVLEKHGWKQVSRNGDKKVFTHPDKANHEIHVSHGSGSWRHYDGDECLGAGFTGEKMRKHLGEETLSEADPHPRVETDHMGKPVIPNRQHFHNYYSDMQSHHIKSALQAAHDRWKQADAEHQAARSAAAANRDKAAGERLRMAQANLRAASTDMAVGKQVLRAKQGKEKKKITKSNKKIAAKTKGAQKFVGGLFKKNPMMKAVVRHVVGALMPKQKKIDAPEPTKSTKFKRNKPMKPKSSPFLVKKKVKPHFVQQPKSVK